MADRIYTERCKPNNAEVIRAMTNEELAKILACPWAWCRNMEIPCEECLREWLKAPAEKDGEA